LFAQRLQRLWPNRIGRRASKHHQTARTSRNEANHAPKLALLQIPTDYEAESFIRYSASFFYSKPNAACSSGSLIPPSKPASSLSAYGLSTGRPVNPSTISPLTLRPA